MMNENKAMTQREEFQAWHKKQFGGEAHPIGQSTLCSREWETWCAAQAELKATHEAYVKSAIITINDQCRESAEKERTISRQSAELKRMREALEDSTSLLMSIGGSHREMALVQADENRVLINMGKAASEESSVTELPSNSRQLDNLAAGLDAQTSKIIVGPKPAVKESLMAGSLYPTPAPAEEVKLPTVQDVQQSIIDMQGLRMPTDLELAEGSAKYWREKYDKQLEKYGRAVVSVPEGLAETQRLLVIRTLGQRQLHSELMEAQKEIASLKSKLAERADVTREELIWTNEYRQEEFERVKAQYQDLIYQVVRVWPGETRHDTAKRYIQEAEYIDPNQQACENKDIK